MPAPPLRPQPAPVQAWVRKWVRKQVQVQELLRLSPPAALRGQDWRPPPINLPR